MQYMYVDQSSGEKTGEKKGGKNIGWSPEIRRRMDYKGTTTKSTLKKRSKKNKGWCKNVSSRRAFTFSELDFNINITSVKRKRLKSKEKRFILLYVQEVVTHFI